MEINTLKDQDQKLATVALLLVARAADIYYHFKASQTLTWQGASSHTGEMKFYEYPNDLTICSLNCLRHCLQGKKPYRGNIACLFVTHSKLFKVP